MNERIRELAELIVREFIVDFYRNHLDTTSNEDITVHVGEFVSTWVVK